MDNNRFYELARERAKELLIKKSDMETLLRKLKKEMEAAEELTRLVMREMEEMEFEIRAWIRDEHSKSN